MSSFFNCHSHSEYSPLDGISYVEDIVKRAIELNYSAVAITDHGEVGGHLELEKYAKQYGIKPIYGIEAYMCEDRFDKDKTKKRGQSTGHMVIVAMNDKGLENLWTLSSLAYLEGKYYDPRIDWDLLEKYNEGLIVTGACMGGWVGKDILTNPKEALLNASKLQAIFGDRFYLELHTYQDTTQEAWNYASVVLAKRLSIPLIVVNDSHYTNPEDWYLHECLTAVQMGKTMSDKTRFQYGPNQLGMLSEAESRQRLSYLPDDIVDGAISNTGGIAEMCNVNIPHQHDMPLFYNDKEMDAEILRKNIETGFNTRIKPYISLDEVEIYWNRILYETGVIIDHGFQGYFLIVQDIISWSKTNDILIGPARGSVAGSIVAKALGIVEVDAIKHGLYFERFLDVGRVSLPDIDIDVPKDQRYLVKEYLETKYGKHSVASIGLFNTMAHKQAIKDLCRGLDIPIADANQISKIIKENNIDGVLLKDLKWQQVLDHYSKEFAHWIAKYPKLFELLPKTVGHIRHHGVHAGGMVVSKDSLIGKLPLRFKTDKGDDEISTQFDMHGVEDLGFVKIDLLGIRTLSTLTEAMRIIKERHGDVLEHFYDWSNNWEKYYEDQQVWDDISSGNNLGVFQLETSNLSHLSKRFKPQSIDELAALLSVCRPGISRTIDEKTGLNYLELYIQKRDKKVPVTYKHPKLKEILGGTLGTLVYQEQAMKIAVEIAGYSLQEADKLRKIIGKSQADKMKDERTNFVTKAVANGTNADLANSIFDEMEKFGQYAFNLSHALGYSLITYWSAYLKTHYPHEYMTALFRTNPEMAPAYTKEARRLGISVLGPDINESGEKFTLTKSNSIRYGLESIKFISGITSGVIEQLQPFDSMAEFVDKIDKSKARINKRAIYSMISVGTFDSLNGNTVDALREFIIAKEGMSKSEDYNHPCKITCELCHGSLIKFKCLQIELNLSNRGANELANLGSLVTINPLQGYTELIRKETTFAGEDYMITGERVIVGGLLSQIKPLITKKGKNPGQKMAQIVLDLPEDDSLFIEETDEEGEITDVNSLQIVVFPSVYKMVEDKLEQGTPVLIKVEKLSSGLSLQNIWRLDLLKNNS